MASGLRMEKVRSIGHLIGLPGVCVVARGFRARAALRQALRRWPFQPAACGATSSAIMRSLIARGVTIRLGGRTLLDRADLTIDPGRRVGLVGRNGAGKSTLLKPISGELAIDDGDIRLAARARLGQVEQEAPGGRQEPGGHRAGRRPGAPGPAGRDGNRADPNGWREIHERLLTIDADSAPARAATILAGLGFDIAAAGTAGEQLLRRLAHARGAGHRAVLRRPTCCCWTSRPTTSTWKPRCGWRRGWPSSRAALSWSATTAACWTVAWTASPISTAARST